VAANHKVVEIPASNLKEITKILFDQGYILSYKFEQRCTNQDCFEV
jgi:small subunit ribosomal protein S8